MFLDPETPGKRTLRSMTTTPERHRLPTAMCQNPCQRRLLRIQVPLPYRL